MMNFLRYITFDKSSIPKDFLLPLEQKLIFFNDQRQRQLKDDRDKILLLTNFLFIKVMAGKLFFKPYKITRFFETEVGNLDHPLIFKENCLGLGYTLIALITDMIYVLYKTELERIEGHTITSSKDIARVKQCMFQDLMPISDDYVMYKDFSNVSNRSEWTKLIEKIKTMVDKTMDAIKQHKYLTDAGMQRRAREDLQEIIKLKTKQYNSIRKEVARNRQERLIREDGDDDSTDSDDSDNAAKRKLKRKKA